VLGPISETPLSSSYEGGKPNPGRSTRRTLLDQGKIQNRTPLRHSTNTGRRRRTHDTRTARLGRGNADEYPELVVFYDRGNKMKKKISGKKERPKNTILIKGTKVTIGRNNGGGG